MAGLEALWMLFYCLMIVASVLPLICTTFAIFRPRWRMWLAVPPVLYLAGLHVAFMLEFVDNWPVLWNPWLYMSPDRSSLFAGFLHLTVSSTVLGISATWLGMLIAAVRWRPSVGKGIGVGIAVAVSLVFVLEFFLTPGVIGFRYETLVENQPLENPVEFVSCTKKSIALADGRVIEFEYDVEYQLTRSIGKVLQVSSQGPDESGDDVVWVLMKVELPRRRKNLITVPLFEEQVPRYGAFSVMGDKSGRIRKKPIADDKKPYE